MIERSPSQNRRGAPSSGWQALDHSPRATDARSRGFAVPIRQVVPVNAATRCNGAASGGSCCNRDSGYSTP